MDRLPSARGPLTDTLLAHLVGDDDIHAVTVEVDPRTDDDLHLALYLCYQLHYGGLEGVPDEFEWDPTVLAFRGVLETAFEDALLADVEVVPPRDARRRSISCATSCAAIARRPWGCTSSAGRRST